MQQVLKDVRFLLERGDWQAALATASRCPDFPMRRPSHTNHAITAHRKVTPTLTRMTWPLANETGATMSIQATMLPPGGGETIPVVNATLKAAMGPHTNTSSFEVIIEPGFDVGAHIHTHGEEIFYVLEGQLDVFAFEPVDRAAEDWHRWVSPSGQRFLRGGPGAFMHVPAGIPHAFANTTDKPVRMFFQSSVPGGHENYFRELADILRGGTMPDADKIARLRARYDIVQLTDLHSPGGG